MKSAFSFFTVFLVHAMEILLSKAAVQARWVTYLPVELLGLSEEIGLEPVPLDVGKLRKNRWDARNPSPLVSELTVRNPRGHARELGCADVWVQLGDHSSEKAGDQSLDMALGGGGSDGESCFKSYTLGKMDSFYFFKERTRQFWKAMKTETNRKDCNIEREWILLWPAFESVFKWQNGLCLWNRHFNASWISLSVTELRCN